MKTCKVWITARKLAAKHVQVNRLVATVETYLRQKVTESPTYKRSERLRRQWVLVKRIIVGSPAWNSASADLGGVTEEWALNSAVLAEGRLDSAGKVLVHRRAR